MLHLCDAVVGFSVLGHVGSWSTFLVFMLSLSSDLTYVEASVASTFCLYVLEMLTNPSGLTTTIYTVTQVRERCEHLPISTLLLDFGRAQKGDMSSAHEPIALRVN